MGRPKIDHMNRFRILFFILAATVASVFAGPRQSTSLDFDWRFHRGDVPGVVPERATNQNLSPKPEFLGLSYDDSSWRRVSVPHDYIVEGAFDPKAENQHDYLPVEPAWYRKTISIPATEKQPSVFHRR